MMAMPERITATFGPRNREVEIGDIVILGADAPLQLDCGKQISHFPVAYQTYGTLNGEKSNAILVCHGLTGDQYVASAHPVTQKAGWWDSLVGPGKPIDTDRYFVICANILGGSMGSYGPKSIDPATGKPFGLTFPVLTIRDMARAQQRLVASFGIRRLKAVIGGSMGGMVALSYAVTFPDAVHAVIPVATSARHSAQNIAFHEIGRQAIMVDEHWNEGRYLEHGTFPAKGLSVARMAAHVTYLSEKGLQKKFGRNLQDRDQVTYGFEADFKVESYLRYQGSAFVERFDPNSYFYITRAMDYFDLAADVDGSLTKAMAPAEKVKFCVVSFSTDWLFPTEESRHLVRALNASGAQVSFTELQSDRGHDAFLLPHKDFRAVVGGFLESLE